MTTSITHLIHGCELLVSNAYDPVFNFLTEKYVPFPGLFYENETQFYSTESEFYKYYNLFHGCEIWYYIGENQFYNNKMQYYYIQMKFTKMKIN